MAVINNGRICLGDPMTYMTPARRLRALLESKGIYNQAIALMKAHRAICEDIDTGQTPSAQDRDDARRSRLGRPSFFTPEEDREVRALRANPVFWDDSEEGLALVARLHKIKAAANARRSR
jgi:hypothetical protein